VYSGDASQQPHPVQREQHRYENDDRPVIALGRGGEGGRCEQDDEQDPGKDGPAHHAPVLPRALGKHRLGLPVQHGPHATREHPSAIA
jgi:hypothetical protein